jgi:hypothetical protein
MHCGTWVPGASGDKVVFCEGCHAIWHVVFDRSNEGPVLELLPAEVHVLLDTNGSLEGVWPLLFREDGFVRDLLLGYFSGARFDLSEAARTLVARMEASDLTLEQGERLLQCLCSLLRGDHRGTDAKHEIAVANLRPLVDLIDREDLLRADRDAAPYAKCRMRDILDEIVALAFTGRGPSHRDALVTEPAFRERLLIVTGAEHRHQQALKQMSGAIVTVERATAATARPDERIHLDDGTRRLSEALVEIEELMLSSDYRLSVDGLRQIALGTRRLGRITAASSSPAGAVADAERDYKDFLQRLLQSRRVPAECLTEVSAALGFHDQPVTDLDSAVSIGSSGDVSERKRGGEGSEGDGASMPRPRLRAVRSLSLGAVAVALILLVSAAAGPVLAPGGKWRAYAVLAAGLVLVLAGGLRMLRPIVRRAHK